MIFFFSLGGLGGEGGGASMTKDSLGLDASVLQTVSFPCIFKYKHVLRVHIHF